MDFLIDRDIPIEDRKKMADPKVGDEVVVSGKVIYSNENYYVVKFVDDPSNSESTAIIPKGQVVKLIEQPAPPICLKQLTDNPFVQKNIMVEKMVVALLVRELDNFKQPTDKTWLHNLAYKDIILDEETMEPLNA